MNRIFTVPVTRRRTEDEKPRRNGQGFVNLGDHLLPGAVGRMENSARRVEREFANASCERQRRLC